MARGVGKELRVGQKIRWIRRITRSHGAGCGEGNESGSEDRKDQKRTTRSEDPGGVLKVCLHNCLKLLSDQSSGASHVCQPLACAVLPLGAAQRLLRPSTPDGCAEQV